MRRTRLAAATAILSTIPLVLAGCAGGSGGGSSEPNTLSILDYYVNDPDKTIMQGAMDECAAKVGVSIERESIPGKDSIQRVLQQASSRTLPDVLLLDNPDVQQIAETGGLTPMSDYGIDTSVFSNGIVDAATYDGKVYGLAPAVNTLGLFYNKALFDQAGIKPPQTWDELKDAAGQLTQGDRYGLAFSAKASYEGTWQFLPFFWSNGADEKDLTSPEAADSLQLWVDLVDAGSVSASVVNWSQGDVKEQFVTGKAAMMINGPWQITSIEKAGIDWGSVQVPVKSAGQDSVAPLGGEVWTVPQTGDKAKQEKAAEIVQCIASPEVSMSLAEQRFLVPTRTDLVDDYIAKVPEMSAFAEQIAEARARTGQLGTEWPKTATAIYGAMQTALTGKATPSEAFKQAAPK